MLERNCVNVHSNFKHSPLLALQKSEPAARIGDFGNFFNGLPKAHVCLACEQQTHFRSSLLAG